jgi:MinD-like ATPase involved in chromosome partitioning or flagellar assembly
MSGHDKTAFDLAHREHVARAAVAPQDPANPSRLFGGAAAPRASMGRAFVRTDLYTRPVVDGRVIRDNGWTRLRRRWQRLITSQREREEADLERQLRQRPPLTRTNLVAVLSPKGGVGKTTCAFLAGDLLASRARLRTLAIDTNPDFGTLGKLAPDAGRSERSLADVIAYMDRIHAAAELYPFVSAAPSGLHLLAAPPDPELMEQMSPERYGQLVAFLGRFYELVLLDLGTGLTEPLARFALERADHALVVATPEWITSSTVVDSLQYIHGRLGAGQLSLVLNQVPSREIADRTALEERFRRHQVPRHITIPSDQRLRTMLDSGTYACERLDRATRLAVKRLGLAVVAQLV